MSTPFSLILKDLPQLCVAEGAAVHTAVLFDQGRKVVLGLGDAVGVGTDRPLPDLHRAWVHTLLIGQVCEQRHPREHAVAGLLEIDRPGIVVHVDGDLVHPGQRMHDQQVLPGPLQLAAGEHINPPVALVFQRVHKALPLNAGHIEHIQLGNDGLQSGDFHKPEATLLHERADILGHRQLAGGDEVKLHALELGQGLDEGVHRAPVLQIAAQPHGQAVHAPPKAGDGGQVGGGLGGVHMPAVPGVDDRYVGVQGGRFGGALFRIAHDHHVGIAGDHLDGVFQGLPLCGGGGARVGKAEHRAAHPEHGGLEGEVGAGGGLIKQAGHDPPPAGVHKIGGVVHNRTAPLVQRFPLRPRQVSKIDQMPHFDPSPLLNFFYLITCHPGQAIGDLTIFRLFRRPALAPLPRTAFFAKKCTV